MEKYSLDVQIRSCVLDKDLIKEVESYLNDRLFVKLSGALELSSDSDIKYNVKLKDSLGEESLFSISEYHRERFPNDIEELTIDFELGYRQVVVRLKFSREITYSYLKIQICCSGAKEIALGVKSEIERILSENKTIHYLFYGKYSWLMWGVFFLSSNSFVWKYFDSQFSYGVLLFFMAISVVYFMVRFVSPYTDFETKRKRSRDKFVSWVLNGLSGVFVFGVLAVYLRDIFI